MIYAIHPGRVAITLRDLRVAAGAELGLRCNLGFSWSASSSRSLHAVGIVQRISEITIDKMMHVAIGK